MPTPLRLAPSAIELVFDDAGVFTFYRLTAIVVAKATALMLDPEDLGVPGDYDLEIEVPTLLVPSLLDDAALDAFHCTVAVNELDDFEFEVTRLAGAETKDNRYLLALQHAALLAWCERLGVEPPTLGGGELVYKMDDPTGLAWVMTLLERGLISAQGLTEAINVGDCGYPSHAIGRLMSKPASSPAWATAVLAYDVAHEESVAAALMRHPEAPERLPAGWRLIGFSHPEAGPARALFEVDPPMIPADEARVQALLKTYDIP